MNRGPLSRKPLFVAFLIIAMLVLLVVLSLHTFYGSEGTDEINYSLFSYLLEAHGLPMLYGGGIDSFKYLTLIGTAFFFKLFGVNTFTEILYNMILYGISIVMLFFLGRKLHSTEAGVIAALFYSVLPLGIYQVARQGDDAVMTFFAILAILLFVYAIKSDNEKRYYALLFLASFTAIIALLSVAEGILIILPIVIAMIYLAAIGKERLHFAKGLLFVIAGAAVATLVILSIGFLAYGKPLYVISGIVTNYSGGVSIQFLQVFRTYIVYMFPIGIPQSEMMYLSETLGFAVSETTFLTETGAFFYIFAAMAFVVLVYRDRRAALPALWFVSIFLYLSFGTMNPTNYLPINWGVPALRYLMIVVPAAALIIGMGLSDLVWGKRRNHREAAKLTGKKRRRLYAKEIALLLFLGFVVVNNIGYINTIKLSMYSYAYPFYHLGQYINTLPAGSSVVVAPYGISSEYFSYLILPFTDYQYYFVTGLSRINCSVLNGQDYLVSVSNGTLQRECGLSTVYTQGPYPNYLRRYYLLGQGYYIFTDNSTFIANSYNLTYAVYKIPGTA